MKKFGFGSKEDLEIIYRILEGEEVQGYDDREEAMRDVQRLLDACYFLGINPLRELRRILPQYEWKYHSTESVQKVRKIVANADFVWFAVLILPDPDMGEDIQLVTATKLDRTEHLSLFFAGHVEKEHSTGRDVARYVSSLGGEATFC